VPAKKFNDYSEVSGQIINNSKSWFYSGAMTSSRAQMIAGMHGFSAGTIPFSYLGCPIFKGKPKGIYFQAIVDRIKAKFATWKGSLLSIMGRVQLVKSIIHGMLVYSFHIYMWPKRLLHQLDSWIKNFIWSGDINTRKVCTVSWKIMCRSWAAGGLDIKPTHLINESLMLHLAWQFSAGTSNWAALLRQRFLKNGTPLQHYFQSSVWGVSKIIWVLLLLTPSGLLVQVRILNYGPTTGSAILWWICYTSRKVFTNIFELRWLMLLLMDLCLFELWIF